MTNQQALVEYIRNMTPAQAEFAYHFLMRIFGGEVGGNE